MGDLKNKAMNNAAPSEDTQLFKLNEDEAAHLRLLNLGLQFHTLAQKIMSGYLYYVCTNRLGYEKGVNLSFRFDFSQDNNMLEVTLLPASLVEEPAPPAPSE